jgi:hypothetical protein
LTAKAYYFITDVIMRFLDAAVKIFDYRPEIGSLTVFDSLENCSRLQRSPVIWRPNHLTILINLIYFLTSQIIFWPQLTLYIFINFFLKITLFLNRMPLL